MKPNMGPPFRLHCFLFETEGRHANAKAYETADHLVSFCQVERRFHSRESNRQPLPACQIQKYMNNAHITLVELMLEMKPMVKDTSSSRDSKRHLYLHASVIFRCDRKV